ARVLRDEADHQLTGKRPVLTADVTDVPDVEADLLLHLAGDRTFKRLAVVHESGHEGVTARRPSRLAGEETAVAILHHHDHRGMQMRIVFVTTLRAPLSPLTLEALRALPASRAVSARAFPPQRLHGHSAERQQVVGEPGALHRHQRLRDEAFRKLDVPL